MRNCARRVTVLLQVEVHQTQLVYFMSQSHLSFHQKARPSSPSAQLHHSNHLTFCSIWLQKEITVYWGYLSPLNRRSNSLLMSNEVYLVFLLWSQLLNSQFEIGLFQFCRFLYDDSCSWNYSGFSETARCELKGGKTCGHAESCRWVQEGISARVCKLSFLSLHRYSSCRLLLREICWRFLFLYKKLWFQTVKFNRSLQFHVSKQHYQCQMSASIQSCYFALMHRDSFSFHESSSTSKLHSGLLTACNSVQKEKTKQTEK